ncbi:hypothetical protein FJZ39_03315 [Candidatus Saccharibacteria bacterium]|nr:hypothetical protein [Candidatus Saccharibacteria bacterium]
MDEDTNMADALDIIESMDAEIKGRSGEHPSSGKSGVTAIDTEGNVIRLDDVQVTVGKDGSRYYLSKTNGYTKGGKLVD